MELNVLGAGYQEDSHLLEQLRQALHAACYCSCHVCAIFLPMNCNRAVTALWLQLTAGEEHFATASDS